jgi:integrase
MDSRQSATLDRTTVAKLALADGKSDQIFFDADLKGFGLRLRSAGDRLRRTWVVQYRVRGRTRRLLIGDYEKISAKQAREKAKDELAKVQLGQDPQAEKETERRNASHTLRAVADDYLAMKRLAVDEGTYRANSYRVTALYLRGTAYFGPLHAMPITDVQLADVARCLNAITRNSGHSTSGRARAALSAMFTWAMRQGYATFNPVAASENADAAPSRDRVLKDTELAAIWRGCGDDEFGQIVRLLILTGCRREEIGGLKWSEIDRDAGTITLPKERVKNKHEHTLPLTPLALAIIDSVPQRVSRDCLFGDRSVNGFTDWDRQKGHLDDRLAGKPADWRLHDLRRSLASWLADDGDVGPHIIEAILNHYSGHRSGVAGVYNRAKYARQIRNALMLWDDHLRSLIEGNARKVLTFPQSA